ncbi:MAG: polyribonucleotide nucleotidyltransferase [Clostridiaceae bacterium]|nr:polyribonucleotide nucleotidyltransferase [Clostridiaceae bacterium]
MEQQFRKTICGRELLIKTGKIAQLANGAVWMQYGDTVVMCTATASSSPRPGIDFFPLSVDYEEKMYSIGSFPGGFLKREGRPTEKAILAARAIDRPMRPLFPKDLRNDVNINCTVLSVEQDCAPDILAMNGASLATAISDIPWNGPIANVQVGIVDGEIIVNPNEAQREASDLDLTLAGTEDLIVMIEAGANEVPDEKMLEAIEKGHEVIKELCVFFKEIIAEIGKPKFTYESATIPAEIMTKVSEMAEERVRNSILSADKAVRESAIDEITEEVTAALVEIDEEWETYVGEAMDLVQKKVVRDYLYNEHRRVDGRGIDEIRPLSAEVDLVPLVHGSGLFQRGQTQVVNIVTLAPLSQAQKLDGLDNQTEKRYIHHYNFPGFSVGEARNSRSPGRREIGHGALAERSLVPVLPSEEDFPYAIRSVSEIMMSNGSTSQGSVCASTLALMAAGVPIKRPVAGISCGLMTNNGDLNDHLVFMDIQGIEDFYGDMDFKVAGTTEGITSIQVDIKVDGLTHEIIREAFEMTRKGRLQILNEVMIPCISEPRTELSPTAPKIIQTQIPVDKISEVIGKGGKTINKIIDETGAQIDIEDDGRVFVFSENQENGNKAMRYIEGIVSDPEPGQVYEGVVTRLMNFGAFVEFLPGKEGMVHISKISWDHVDQVEDVLSVGDVVTVMVSEIDSQGRINLSMRDCMEKPDDYVEPQRKNRGGRGGRNDDRNRRDRKDRDRGGRGSRGGRGDRGHFRERS